MAKDKNILFCIGCGAELPPAARFCSQCGQSQTESRQSDDSAPGAIHLKRRFAINNGAVPMMVYVDEKHVGSVKNGATANFPVIPGEHKFFVSIGIIKSDPLALRVNAGQQIHVNCGYEGFFSEAIFLRLSK